MSVTANPGSGGAVFGTRTISGIDYSYTIPGFVTGGVFAEIGALNGMPVSGAVSLADPTTPANKATVAVFHNADNQALGGSAYGLLTGGVAQIVNPLGNVDRQRGAGLDGIAAVGLATAATNLVMTFKTTIPIIAVANNQNVTPAAMSGTIGGVPWTIQTGTVLTIDTGVNKENVIVTSVTTTAFNATFTKTHAAGSLVVSSVYNQARDAAGEADGATGIGTSVAAEYEYNGGAPGNANFDRARSVQAKGRTVATISAGGGAGSASLTVAAAGTLKAGMQVTLVTGAFPAGNIEVVYVDVSYVEGTVTVPLATAIVNAGGYTGLAYDSFAVSGPGLNGFNATGVGIEEEALYDPVSGLFYLERAATADGMAPQNIVAENAALWNGTSMDRSPGSTASGAIVGGRVTTNAPTPANGAMAALSFDTNNNLRSVDATVAAAAGTLTDAAPANDTASASLNGRLQRVAQNITALAGVDATGATQLTGGTGIRGWLSGLFTSFGTQVDAAWNGVTTSASAVSILKLIATGATPTGDFVVGRMKLVDSNSALLTSSTILGKQRLDVNLAAGVIPGNTAPGYMDQVGGVDTGGNARAFLMDTAGRPFVNINGATIKAASTPAVVTDPALVVVNRDPITIADAPNLAVGQISVATTATQIVAARAGRRTLTIITESTTAVRMGPVGVTTGTGILLPGTANTGFTVNGFTGALYGITASGTEAVSFLETY